MNRNLKLDERIQILVLHRQGFNITQISEHLNVARATARRWIQRNEEEGSLSDRPRPHPPRKNKPQVGAQNATETQKSQASKNKKKNSRTNTPSRISARSKKHPTATPEKQTEKVDNLPESTETHEPPTSKTNKSSRTKNNSKSTRTSSGSNKQSAAPTPETLSQKDDKIPEATEESQSSETNNTSSTGLSDTNKRKKKPAADVKLPEAEELIASVYKFLQAEYDFLKYYIGDICDLSPLINVLKRTADACGVCKYTVRQIVDKKRAQDDQYAAGSAKRAKLRQQVLQISSLAEKESSCSETEEEEKEEEDKRIMDDDSIIKVEESSSSDSDDELDDEDKYIDNYSESDEYEVEAPNMEIDDDKVKPLDPLKTEPIEVKTETTDVVNSQSLDPIRTQPVEVKRETTDIETSKCSSDVILMTSPAPIKTEPDDNCTHSSVAFTNNMVCETTSYGVKCEPPVLFYF